MGKLLSRKKVIGGLVGAGVLSAALAAPAVAFADDSANPAPSPSASAPATSTSPDSGKPGQGHNWQGHDQRWADRRGDLAKELATELGVPQDKVEAALAKIRQKAQEHRQDWQKEHGKPAGTSAADRAARLKTRLDKAVSDGRLTREQADAIVAAVKAGVLPGGFGHGPAGKDGQTGDQSPAPTTR
ncbi:hypothetical protein [Plantactinospora sonchi]|uniref:Uncharacterized protein n=1 Tax=Plantactinospora sonchi TaxID=1544735 RepID=A0ABU7S053_9ACTN